MGKDELSQILEDQKIFFASGRTLDIDFRIGNLRKLKSLILSYEEELSQALHNDFHKPVFEVLGSETRYVIAEINMMIRNLRRWSERQRVRTSIVNFPARSYIQPRKHSLLSDHRLTNISFLIMMM